MYNEMKMKWNLYHNYSFKIKINLIHYSNLHTRFHLNQQSTEAQED